MTKPIVWTIAGSDSGGGAGIQADLHTFQSLGVHGCTVITAITAQNSVGVDALEKLPLAIVQQQIQTLAADLKPQGIKIGLLTDNGVIDVLADFLKDYGGMVVFDPVLSASVGKDFGLAKAIPQWITQLFPYVDCLTPNLREAEKILGYSINSHGAMEQAATALLSLGPKSVLLKGGHLANDNYAQDYWCDQQQGFWLIHPRQASPNHHGSGCTLSSAIAAALATGYSLANAVVIGKMVVNEGIRNGRAVGQGLGPVAHNRWPENSKDLPWLSTKALTKAPSAFPSCGPKKIGLYPIVDSLDWIKRLAPFGIDTMQLRIKNKSGFALTQEIQQAIVYAKEKNIRLFINDHWQVALENEAYGVHLGQEDLLTADVDAIRQAGLRLGVSTHDYVECTRAHGLRPSYIALGPIYPTTSKPMDFAPQGIPTLKRWCSMCPYPVVAIGGINEANLDAVLQAPVDGVAMISAITQAQDLDGLVAALKNPTAARKALAS